MLGGVLLAILFVSHPRRAQLPRDSLCPRFIGRWVVQGAPSHTRPVDSRPGGGKSRKVQLTETSPYARDAANSCELQLLGGALPHSPATPSPRRPYRHSSGTARADEPLR